MNNAIQFFFEYPVAYIPAAIAMSAFTAVTLACSIERLAVLIQKAK